MYHCLSKIMYPSSLLGRVMTLPNSFDDRPIQTEGSAIDNDVIARGASPVAISWYAG